ncbi:hypothetical protein BD770DRAFT_151365 [Pilaira anomala]|nr:hypothetical protein BD770DRAFT_151365 [Pilaira anomala]
MKANNNDGKVMIPDLALYVVSLSTMNFELFVVEVKKQGNYINGNLEKDLIKLGKEMKLALDKLLQYKVKNPEVPRLLVEGIKITAYKMDLAYNGVYRMIELSEFYACRGNINDIMLIPTIMQRLDEVKTVVEETKKKFFVPSTQGRSIGSDIYKILIYTRYIYL